MYLQLSKMIKKNFQALAADGVWTLYQDDSDQSDNKEIVEISTQARCFCFVKG